MLKLGVKIIEPRHRPLLTQVAENENDNEDSSDHKDIQSEGRADGRVKNSRGNTS